MILIAIESNARVYAYNEEKQLVLNKQGKLYNYNNNFVAISRISDIKAIDVFNSNGELVCTYPYDLINDSNTSGVVL